MFLPGKDNKVIYLSISTLKVLLCMCEISSTPEWTLQHPAYTIYNTLKVRVSIVYIWFRIHTHARAHLNSRMVLCCFNPVSMETNLSIAQGTRKDQPASVSLYISVSTSPSPHQTACLSVCLGMFQTVKIHFHQLPTTFRNRNSWNAYINSCHIFLHLMLIGIISSQFTCKRTMKSVFLDWMSAQLAQVRCNMLNILIVIKLSFLSSHQTTFDWSLIISKVSKGLSVRVLAQPVAQAGLTNILTQCDTSSLI